MGSHRSSPQWQTIKEHSFLKSRDFDSIFAPSVRNKQFPKVSKLHETGIRKHPSLDCDLLERTDSQKLVGGLSRYSVTYIYHSPPATVFAAQ